MLPKLFLSVVGLMYLGLAAWCSFAPGVTSSKVGFTLNGGSGRSEFLTVYGGLELGLALVFLMPWWRPESLGHALWSCLFVHGMLVVFRTVGFVMFEEIGGMTYRLALGEWVILVLSAIMVYRYGR